MSEPIGVGDWVECVNAEPFEDTPVPLTLGARYRVLRVWDYLPHGGDPTSDWYDCSIDLVGVPDPAPGLAWGLYRFKPVGRPSESLFLTRLMDVPADPEQVTA